MAERNHFSSEKWEVISQENQKDAPEEQGASFFMSQEHYKVISCDMKKPSGRIDRIALLWVEIYSLKWYFRMTAQIPEMFPA